MQTALTFEVKANAEAVAHAEVQKGVTVNDVVRRGHVLHSARLRRSAWDGWAESKRPKADALVKSHRHLPEDPGPRELITGT